ncbi:starch synthase 1, chloroplastic/amyloplastic-like isoform X1 [Dendrobium catenatum]|uniref:starch synthase 1, chloroplastic/amyloplastic-like isoform X1 n=1 Tax=Dendrobium catenatum TaxID=906689 RepID=UPI00109F8A83|nr:starch synthase 1, chloroplastic/amyloplastic-like isoform X1 [Dendrobium catenatum]
MEALRPFYSYFSVALSPSGPLVRRRVAVLAAAGFPSHRYRNYECLRPMRCVLKKNKKRRSLLFKETDDPGNVEVYIPSAADDAGTATETFTTIELDERESSEDKKHTIVQRIIIFVTSEAAPYSKTGGLADVCGSLPIAFAARGHRVMVVSPRYLNGVSDKKYAASFDTGVRIKVPCFGDQPEVGFFHEYRAGVDWVFVDHPSYHRPGNPYGDENGAFGDNQFRFTILCHAACEAPLVLPLGGYTYGQNCFFLVNDWHAGLVPLLLAAKYRPHGVYKDARSILVIHNLAHQGVEPAATYHKLGLPPDWYGAVEWVFPTWARTHALDKGETVNILKGAIVTVDRIVTVSQGYAWEITTGEGGCGLQDLLSNRKSVLNGITNGIDIDEWDPASDKHIPFHYSIDNLSGKVGSLLCMQSSSFAKCKAALQKELGFAIRSECPVIGFIGRLDYQKGTDLIMMAIPELLQHDIQFVSLGFINDLVKKYACIHPCRLFLVLRKIFNGRLFANDTSVPNMCFTPNNTIFLIRYYFYRIFCYFLIQS